MAAGAAADARAKLAAAYCVSRFESSPDAKAQLAALKAAFNFERGDLIAKKGWTIVPGDKKPVPGAADICAENIVEAHPASAHG